MSKWNNYVYKKTLFIFIGITAYRTRNILSLSEQIKTTMIEGPGEIKEHYGEIWIPTITD